MKTLNISENTQETSKIDLSENIYYKEKENEFLALCQNRMNIFIDHYELPENYTQQILPQIPNKIKKTVSPVYIAWYSKIIEKYKIVFFLDSSLKSEIIHQTKYYIWKKNMEKYIQTPASLTSRILKVLSHNDVKNIDNLSVEDFLWRFESFPDKVKKSLFEEKTRLEKHSQRVNQAQWYLDNMKFSNFSEDKIRQDGWFTGFYESVDFPEIEQKFTIPDMDYEMFVAERKKNEPQPVFANETPIQIPTKKVETRTKLTVASLLLAGPFVTWSIYLQIDDYKSQKNVPSAMKFNESWFQRAFQDMIYSQMQKWKQWSEIEEYVMERAWRISIEYWLDPSLYHFNITKVNDEVVLKLQQYWQLMYEFRVVFWTKFPYYTDNFHDAQFSEELKMYLSIALDDFKMKSNQKDFLDNVENYLYEKMAEYVRVNQWNWKYSPFKWVISRNYNEIKIEFIFTKADETINYQTELIIHL